MSELPKVSQQLSDPISENLQKLATLFPAAVKDGELDIEALREELGDFAEIQPGDEKYELNWAGKQAAKKKAFEPLLGKTLKYVAKDSKHPDSTENIYIEGDNLEALKLLRQNYYGAIKMIYIDPPYNTGEDFVYADNFNISKESSDQSEGAISDTGERLVKNEKSSNRYHSRWLDMMYPRLKLARDLLKEDGVIFISIDDNEVANLRNICDDIFGNINFVGEIVRETIRGGSKSSAIRNVHDYCLCYSKDKTASGFGGFEKEDIVLDKEDDKGKYKQGRELNKWGAGSRREDSPGMWFPIEGPSGVEVFPIRNDGSEGRWRLGKEKMYKKVADGDVIFEQRPDGTYIAYEKIRETRGGIKQLTTLFSEHYTNSRGTNRFKKVFDIEKSYFDYVKPIELIKHLCVLCCIENEDIVLDFFSGSASSADAILQINAEEGGNRKYIMVQLPEDCDEKSEAAKASYKTIAEIGKERIRRAGEKIKAELVEKHQALLNEDGELELDDKAPETNPYILNPDSLDIGFKCFRIEDTQINWLKKDLSGGELVDADISSKDKLDFVPGFTDLDVVYEIMLRQSSIPLTQPIMILTDIGKRTYLYGDSYLICLEEDINKEMVEKLAKLEPTPLKFIFRDSAFGKDIAFKDETFRRLNVEIAKNTDGDETYTVEFI